MQAISEIVANRKTKAEQTKAQSGLQSTLNQGTQGQTQQLQQLISNLSQDQQSSLKEAVGGLKLPDVTLQFAGGVKAIQVDAAKITGLDDLQQSLTRAVMEFQIAIERLRTDLHNLPAPQVTVQAPDVHVPPITVPTPQVTVNVPEAKAPEATPETPQPRLVAENYEYNAKGQLHAVVERYEDGSLHRATGFDTGRVTHEY